LSKRKQGPPFSAPSGTCRRDHERCGDGSVWAGTSSTLELATQKCAVGSSRQGGAGVERGPLDLRREEGVKKFCSRCEILMKIGEWDTKNPSRYFRNEAPFDDDDVDAVHLPRMSLRR
jgi:hypothetical protein